MKTKRDVVRKIMVELARVLLAVTFLFSGFVKAVDPRGFAYKIDDYLSAFHLTSLSALALPVAIALCVLEFTLGYFMLLGIHRKRSSRAVLIVMCIMTPLTLYLALFNPVKDCGCFGDALIITNWQTFFKNIVLLICAIVSVRHCERITNFYTGKFYWLVTFFGVCYILAFGVYNSIYEPIFDFRPYKMGANLFELTKVKDGQGDVYANTFVYEKDGKKQEFTEQNYPWKDSTWHFVSMDTKMLKEGLKPKIEDFQINKLLFDRHSNEIVADEDITQDVLAFKGYTFLMSAYNLPQMDDSHLGAFEDVLNYAKDHGYNFYCLTSSLKEDITKWQKENVSYNFCMTDERVLKTMVRSNPGLVLLKDGVIVYKWADLEVPDEAVLNKPLGELSFPPRQSEKHLLFWLVLLLIIPIAILKGLDVLLYRERKEIEHLKEKVEEKIETVEHKIEGLGHKKN